MELNLGGIETIANPSVEDVRHYLKFMPAESPFIILSEGDTFIQSEVYTLTGYRVEYKGADADNVQFYCDADYESACDLFASFLAGRDDYKTATQWRPFKFPSVWSTPNHPVALILFCILMLGSIALSIWAMFN